MKLHLNSRGYALSPFFIIITMVLGAIFIQHFMVIDTPKAEMIAKEGGITKEMMKDEGYETGVNTATLFAAYEAIDQATKPVYGSAYNPMESEDKLKRFILQEIELELRALIEVEELDLDYKDERGRIRKDGFIVTGKGSIKVNGIPTDNKVVIEKFVDSGIFGFFKKAKNAPSQLRTEIATAMMCKLGSLSCYSRHESIYCYLKNDYKHFNRKYTKPNETIYTDAGEVVRKINESIHEIAIKETKGTAFRAYVNADAAVTFSVDYINAMISRPSIRETRGECCYFVRQWGTKTRGNYCKDDQYETDYWISYTIEGRINVKNLTMIGNAAMTQKDDYFRTCAKSIIINKEGQEKALIFEESEFEIPYRITIAYTRKCDPGTSFIKNDHASMGPLQRDEWIPKIEFDQNSLKFLKKIDECKWETDTTYKSECDTGIKMTRAEFEACSICHAACYVYDDRIDGDYTVTCPLDS